MYDTVRIRIFTRSFHFVTNRSLCADFCLINEGPQNIQSIYQVKKRSVTKKGRSLGKAEINDSQNIESRITFLHFLVPSISH